MNIIEATRIALKEDKCIYNTAFPRVKMKPDLGMPFDIMRSDGNDRQHNWNPSGEDILSNKWEVCD